MMDVIKCILIDDETESLDRLESLLLKFEFVSVLSKIENPDSALNEITKHKPALVFIDVEMPRKSGFDIISEVRELGLRTKFIFVTGYNQYAIKAIRAQAFDFLLKPIDIDELKDALYRFNENNYNNIEQFPKHLIAKYNLSEREVEIIKHLILGKSSKQIANQLFISKHTVDTHRKNILEKTKLDSTAELVGLIQK